RPRRIAALRTLAQQHSTRRAPHWRGAPRRDLRLRADRRLCPPAGGGGGPTGPRAKQISGCGVQFPPPSAHPPGGLARRVAFRGSAAESKTVRIPLARQVLKWHYNPVYNCEALGWLDQKTVRKLVRSV